MIYIIIRLFYEFFKIGLFAVGGGLATLPFLYDLSDNTGWFENAQIIDMIAVSESTPGPMGVNMSTYSGFLSAGVLGGIVATLGLIVPSIIIIIIIAKFLDKFKESKTVKDTFSGLRPASIALIATAGISVVKHSLINIDGFLANKVLLELFNIKGIVLAVIIFFLMSKFNKHPVFYILISAVAGIVFKMGAF